MAQVGTQDMTSPPGPETNVRAFLRLCRCSSEYTGEREPGSGRYDHLVHETPLVVGSARGLRAGIIYLSG